MSLRSTKRRRVLAGMVYMGTCYLVPAGILSVFVLATLSGSALEKFEELMSLADWRGGLAMGGLLLAVIITTFAGLGPLLNQVRRRRWSMTAVAVLSIVHALAALAMVAVVTTTVVIVAFAAAAPVVLLLAPPSCWLATALSGEIVRGISDRILRRS